MISVIIPAFNRGYIIRRSIESVLNQSYKDIEVIVIDDGSTDDTSKVIKDINDNRIKYIKLEKNYGANVARNIGIENARGNLIAFQDSDDVWVENKLEHEVKAMKENNVDIVFCSMEVYYNTKNKAKLVPNKKQKSGHISYSLLLKGSIASTQTLLVKKECLDNIKFDPELPRLQDWDLMLRLSKEYKVYFLNEVLVKAEIQDNSISTNPEKGLTSIKEIIQKNKREIESSKELKSLFYEVLAFFSFKDKKETQRLYLASLTSKFRFRVLAKFLLFKLGLYPF